MVTYSSTFLEPSRASRILRAARLFGTAGLILVLLVWIKTKNVHDFSGDYLLISYTIFVTLFQLARIMSALFYKTSLDGITDATTSKTKAGEKEYEPFISFVVPCKNEEGAIHKTITTCLEAEYPSHKLEVIVINDGSTDKTGLILDELKKEHPGQLKVIHWKKNRGKRHGMMTGFNLSKGEIIIQLDSDSYIYPSSIRALIEPFKNPSIGAVCAHADPENADQNFITKMQAAYYFMSFRILKAAESSYGVVFCCSGCSSAYRRSAVIPILKYWISEKFLGSPVTWGDDRSLTSWVIKCGHKTIYTDKAKAVTIVPATFRQLIKQQIRWKKSWIINSIFTAKFIFKKEPFVALIYYYPLVLVSILTPFMAIRALLYLPFKAGLESTAFYFLGVILITSLLTIMCRYVAKENKYWQYLFAWAGVNIFVISFLFFYAAATIQNRSWGTR